MKTTHTICLWAFGLAFLSGSLSGYSHESGTLNIIVSGSEPRDTIGIVSYSGDITLDSAVLTDETIDVVVDASEKVALNISAPDDSTLRFVMTMAVEDMCPVPQAGMPESVSIEMINPSIVADGVSGVRKMEASDVKLTTSVLDNGSAEHKLDSLLSHRVEGVEQKTAKK